MSENSKRPGMVWARWFYQHQGGWWIDGKIAHTRTVEEILDDERRAMVRALMTGLVAADIAVSQHEHDEIDIIVDERLRRLDAEVCGE